MGGSGRNALEALGVGSELLALCTFSDEQISAVTMVKVPKPADIQGGQEPKCSLSASREVLPRPFGLQTKKSALYSGHSTERSTP